jgi:hypothetical protein
MRKPISYILAICIVALLFVAVKLLFKQLRLQSENEKMSEYLLRTDNLFACFSETLRTFIYSDGFVISNIELIDSKGNCKMLSEIVENEKMLVYLPNISCNTCTGRETELVNSIFGDRVKDVLIVSNFESRREQIVFERESHITTFTLKRDEIFPSPELSEHIVIFLISKELRGHCLLLPDEDNNKVSEIYYQAVSEKFSNNVQKREKHEN